MAHWPVADLTVLGCPLSPGGRLFEEQESRRWCCPATVTPAGVALQGDLPGHRRSAGRRMPDEAEGQPGGGTDPAGQRPGVGQRAARNGVQGGRVGRASAAAGRLVVVIVGGASDGLNATCTGMMRPRWSRPTPDQTGDKYRKSSPSSTVLSARWRSCLTGDTVEPWPIRISIPPSASPIRRSRATADAPQAAARARVPDLGALRYGSLGDGHISRRGTPAHRPLLASPATACRSVR